MNLRLGKTGQKGDEARTTTTARRQVKEGPAARPGQLADRQQEEETLQLARNSARAVLNRKPVQFLGSISQKITILITSKVLYSTKYFVR